MKKDQNENPRNYLKGQMPLPNIHINKGKYPQSGKEIKTFNTISNISCISQVYADKPKQSMLYAVGSKQLYL